QTCDLHAMSTEAPNMPTNFSNNPTFKWQSFYLGYGIVMFVILLIGFLGNLLTILVLRQRQHRRKSITPLMMNLAIADLLIVVFGYPVIISNNLNGDLMRAGSPFCIWSGFINSTTGITSIATLTAMSGVVAGFFIPLMLITMFHYLTYRLIKRRSQSSDRFIQLRRQKYQQKIVFMTTAAILAFLLSWSPYCIVSFAAIIKGSHVLSSGEAEVPELMAKASVIYNPIVYTLMNEGFRRTLWGLLVETTRLWNQVTHGMRQTTFPVQRQPWS
ncbi:hypothetical protein OS493_030356, partial [Desmophyllum pertusum]